MELEQGDVLSEGIELQDASYDSSVHTEKHTTEAGLFQRCQSFSASRIPN